LTPNISLTMGLFSWLTNSGLLDFTLTAGSLFTATFITLLYKFQTRLIYLPQFPPGARTEIWRPSQFGFHPKHDEEVFITTADGVQVHGYWLSDEANEPGHDLPTFIYFQGNAGNIVLIQSHMYLTVVGTSAACVEEAS